jgi:hypothetical protein
MDDETRRQAGTEMGIAGLNTQDKGLRDAWEAMAAALQSLDIEVIDWMATT